MRSEGGERAVTLCWLKDLCSWLGKGLASALLAVVILCLSCNLVTSSKNSSNKKNSNTLYSSLIESLSNHDDDGNKNPTNLHIWQWKTVFLHALHVHFSSFGILKTFSFFLRSEMTSFAVVWTTWAYDDQCSILSSKNVPSAGSNLIPG